jgi:hypothetical protein
MVMLTIYLLDIIWSYHTMIPHAGFDHYKKMGNLKSVLFGNVWPLSLLPTLIYTWQYYEVVDNVANPKRGGCTYYLR